MLLQSAPKKAASATNLPASQSLLNTLVSRFYKANDPVLQDSPGSLEMFKNKSPVYAQNERMSKSGELEAEGSPWPRLGSDDATSL